MSYNYSFKDFKEDMSRAVGLDLPISRKQAIEVCNVIRGKDIEKARKILADAIEMKKAIPFKRFTNGLGHKKGKVGAGRYAVNCCKEILKLINQAGANAQFKGLSTNLDIIHLSVKKAGNQLRYGRKYGRQRKSTHVEVVLKEKAVKKEAKKGEEKADVKKDAKESTKVEAKESTKVEAPIKKEKAKIPEKPKEVKKIEEVKKTQEEKQ